MSSLFESLAAMSAEAQEKNKEFSRLREARWNQKAEYCAEIESTAMRLCGWINCILDDKGERDAVDIRDLTEALDHAAAAMHSAEAYANMSPDYGLGIGL